MTQEAAVRAAVAADMDWIQAFLAQLVRTPSVNPKFEADPALNREAEVQDILEEELRALGFATSRQEPLPGRPNLIGLWPGGQANSLALCGHVDVVPVGDAAAWVHAPFGAEIADGRMYGRGTVDMKAGLVACLAACRAFRALEIPLSGRVEFHAVVDEEAGGFGAMTAAAREPRPSAVLVAEGSGNAVRPWAGGLDWVRVTVRGRNGHSSRRFASIYPSEAAAGIPVLSVNALELGARVLGAVQALEAQWGREKRFPHLPAGMNTISPGMMIAGVGMGADGLPNVLNNPGIVPDTCVLDFDLKFLPHEDPATIRRDFEAALMRFAATDPWLAEHPPQVQWDLYGLHFPPVNTPAGHPLVEALVESRKAVSLPVRLEGMLGVTDAAHYAARGIPGVVYGPSGANAHGPDEYVALGSVVEAAQDIAATILHYCG
ncbi:acetylornithine deacetylase [Roseomonas mucosa]|uniref:Probable succinyl-diaminopimelate desuccinylase n=1 Tax=Roseomonas mucosa TaxID=207340 RepID=A0A1S8D3G9_9PROT|nr:ArgE/DapE family deacylase [Roseomonas mucosa]ONH82873.1 acetylornithine deacetylase [Roseomonas mucosa]